MVENSVFEAVRQTPLSSLLPFEKELAEWLPKPTFHFDCQSLIQNQNENLNEQDLEEMAKLLFQTPVESIIFDDKNLELLGSAEPVDPLEEELISNLADQFTDFIHFDPTLVTDEKELKSFKELKHEFLMQKEKSTDMLMNETPNSKKTPLKDSKRKLISPDLNSLKKQKQNQVENIPTPAKTLIEEKIPEVLKQFENLMEELEFQVEYKKSEQNHENLERKELTLIDSEFQEDIFLSLNFLQKAEEYIGSLLPKRLHLMPELAVDRLALYLDSTIVQSESVKSHYKHKMHIEVISDNLNQILCGLKASLLIMKLYHENQINLNIKKKIINETHLLNILNFMKGQLHATILFFSFLASLQTDDKDLLMQIFTLFGQLISEFIFILSKDTLGRSREECLIPLCFIGLQSILITSQDPILTSEMKLDEAQSPRLFLNSLFTQIQYQSVRLLVWIFSSFPKHRPFIMDEILFQLPKLPSLQYASGKSQSVSMSEEELENAQFGMSGWNGLYQAKKKPFFVYKLQNGKSVHLCSVLLIQLIQSCAVSQQSAIPLNFEEKENEKDETKEKEAEPINNIMEEISSQIQNLLVVLIQKTLIVKDNITPQKPGKDFIESKHEEYRMILDGFISDCLQLLGQYEFPIVYFILNHFEKLLLEIIICEEQQLPKWLLIKDLSKRAALQYKSMAFEWLGWLIAKFNHFRKTNAVLSNNDQKTDLMSFSESAKSFEKLLSGNILESDQLIIFKPHLSQRVLQCCFSGLKTNSIALKCKILKCIHWLLLSQSDSELQSRASELLEIIYQSVVDEAGSVRDAAVEVFGYCWIRVNQEPLWLQYYPLISSRVLDTSTAVRKRVLKLFQNCFPLLYQMNNRNFCLDIFMKLFKRSQNQEEENTVRELASRILLQLLFSQQPVGVFFCQICLAIPNDQLLIDFFKGKDIPNELLDWIWQQWQLDHDEHYLKALSLLAVIKPSATAPYLKSLGSQWDSVLGSGHQEKTLWLLQILENCLPLFEKSPCQRYYQYQDWILEDQWVYEMEKKMLVMTLKHAPQVVSALVRCLSRWIQSSGDYILMDKLLKQVLGFLSQHQHQQLNDIQMNSLQRALLILSLLIRHFPLQSDLIYQHFMSHSDQQVKEVEKYREGGMLEFSFQLMTHFATQQQQQSEKCRLFALEALGTVWVTWPQLIIRQQSLAVLEAAFQSGQLSFQYQALHILCDFLKEDEVRMLRLQKTAAGRNKKSLRGESEEYLESGLASSLIQQYMPYVLQLALSQENEIRMTSFEVIYLVLKHGLFHPLQCMPVLIALESGDALGPLKTKALKIHQELSDKHASFIHNKNPEGIRLAYELQTRLGLGKGYHVQPETSEVLSLLQPLYHLVRDKKQKRLRLIQQSFISLIDRDWQLYIKEQQTDFLNELKFLQFLMEAVCSLDYKTLEEPAMIIFHLNKMISLATNYDDQLKQQQLKEWLPLSMIHSCFIISRKYLQKVYQLSDLKCESYRPQGNNKSFEKMVSRLSEGPLDWSHLVDQAELVLNGTNEEAIKNYIEQFKVLLDSVSVADLSSTVVDLDHQEEVKEVKKKKKRASPPTKSTEMQQLIAVEKQFRSRSTKTVNYCESSDSE